jgi:THO complex subunit 5
MSADQPAVERLGTLCTSLRTRLAEAVAAKSSAVADGGASASAVLAEGSLALIDLKAVNRSVWELVNSYKERTQRANAGVDAAELKLQNLQYEKNHFLREITHLRDFRPDAGPKISLIDEAAFALQAPAELLSVSKAEDPHQFHLNRLQLELRQRKALCEVRRGSCPGRAGTPFSLA